MKMLYNILNKVNNFISNNSDNSNNSNNSNNLLLSKTENNDDAYGIEDMTNFYDLLNYLVAINDKLIGQRGIHTKNNLNILFEILEKYTYNVSKLNDYEDKKLCLNYLFKLILYTRDIHYGKGERYLFYKLLLYFYKINPTCKQIVFDIIPYITGGYKLSSDIKPYGSFLDLNKLLEIIYKENIREEYYELVEYIIEHYIDNIFNDYNSDSDSNISLAAKWIPKVGKSLDKKYNIAKLIIERCYPTYTYNVSHKYYRQMISELNERINTTEKYMCNDRWEEIEVKNVPSKCFHKNKKALLNITIDNLERCTNINRNICRNKFLEEINKPVEESKLNASTMEPHELVQHYKVYDESIEMQWLKIKNNIWKDLETCDFKPGLCLCDVSASMHGTPLNACITFGILLSSMLPKPWKNQIITFEDNPNWVSLDDSKSLFYNINKLKDSTWGSSTNFQAVFELILSLAVENNIPQDGMPEYLYIFSDMQFNQTQNNRFYKKNNSFEDQKEKIDKAFNLAGYSTPKLVFWNLRGDTDTFVAKPNTKDVITMSGFSTKLFKQFLNGNLNITQTPLDNLLDTLDNERYNYINL